ncbi:unnamed protein product [Brassica oleracea var. botrytis]
MAWSEGELSIRDLYGDPYNQPINNQVHRVSSIRSADSSYVTFKFSAENNNMSIRGNCLGWCSLLIATLHACKSCK